MKENGQQTASAHSAQLRFAGLLLLIGVSRHLPLSYPEWANFSPTLAILLLSGTFIKGHLSWITPICAILISDLIINPSYGLSLLEPFMLVTSLSYLVVFFIGKSLGPRSGLKRLLVGGLMGALAFHALTCGFAWWANPIYAKTVGGFIQALTLGEAGYPPAYLFLRNSVSATLLFTALFGWIAIRTKVSTSSLARTAPAT